MSPNEPERTALDHTSAIETAVNDIRERINEIANRFANALLGAGLAPADRVLLICENSVEAFLAKIGAAKAGLVAVPLNPSLAPDVLEHLIGHADVGRPIELLDVQPERS